MCKRREFDFPLILPLRDEDTMMVMKTNFMKDLLSESQDRTFKTEDEERSHGITSGVAMGVGRLPHHVESFVCIFTIASN